MPTKRRDGKWIVDVRPEGVSGKRVRKQFDSHAEAARFEAFVRGKAAEGKPWNPSRADDRRLSSLINEWFTLHGSLLSDGDRRLVIMHNVCESLGDPVARTVTEADFMRYRASSDAAPKTLNNQLGYLNAVYNKLKSAKVINYGSPLQGLAFIKYEKRELHFLTHEQIQELLDATAADQNPDVYLCTWLCLETGARWGEAERQQRNLVRQHGQRYSVTFTDTKGKRTRTVPISKALHDRLHVHNAPKPRVFDRCMRQFNRIANGLSFKLPERQNTHILRHTFASHFVMNGGSILVLQKILGHVDIKETMRYAHLSPDHLESALKLGPLSGQKVDTQRRHFKKTA